MNNRDIHVLKYFSSFVSISRRKVINITEPSLTFCPLAAHLYKDFRSISGNDKEVVKDAIKKAIESKIRDYGFFTDDRKFLFDDVSIPYGASEMLSFALKKRAIDAVVLVCEGAGTVVTSKADIVQGIGARMNSLLLTSPIKGIIRNLKSAGCQILFENALIDQIRGVEKAIKSGHKNIAVTVCGHSAGDLKTIRLLEKEYGVSVICLAVCTTGIGKDKINMIRDCADLVWSCASSDTRRIIGPLAVFQLSRQIPVFVLTKKGVNFVSEYAQEEETIKNLDIKKQYLVSNEPSGQCVHLGGLKAYIAESELPVSPRKDLMFEDNSKCAAM
jgi:putative methanogenesis marker protein 8